VEPGFRARQGAAVPKAVYAAPGGTPNPPRPGRRHHRAV